MSLPCVMRALGAGGFPTTTPATSGDVGVAKSLSSYIHAYIYIAYIQARPMHWYVFTGTSGPLFRQLILRRALHPPGPGRHAEAKFTTALVQGGSQK